MYNTMNMYYDPTYILVLIAALVSFIASMNVKSCYKKYNKVRSAKGLSGAEAARMILDQAGLRDIRIEHVSGSLTDHYSPSDRVLRLSDDVYASESIAAIGVAAHECGHAIQHKENYAPLTLRTVAVPVANFGSKLSWPIILIGLLFGAFGIARLGVLLFFFVVVFQLITLPVEFNASRRAVAILDDSIILEQSELGGVKKVLTAAALTYVAALFASIMQLVRLLILTQGNSRRRK